MLKAGTRIEDRRLQEAEALLKCLAFDAVTAWRVFSLDRYARDEPETPAAEVLTEDEREVIGIIVRGERLLPPAVPAGHPELGRAAGAHRGLAALDAASLAGQRGLVAGLRAAADDGPRDASSQSALAIPGPAPASNVTKR